ncbi:kinesin-like protein [Haematococcus lacustris]|uniref:Kinesin-like protein n=1 Tax=Haematococcus lacustris TaxID=44745 RepID=A0A699Y8I4_HAELA|nr:kinesin-like protein [Haematococcus lacustris]
MGPADWNYDETLSTLRYANRAKNIKNKPRINEDPKDAMLREFQDEIAKLKAMLEAEGGGGDFTVGANGTVERIVTKPKALDPAMLDKAQRMEEERRVAEEEAAKMARKQAKIQQEAARTAEDADKIRLEKEALAKKLKAMESKILKGEARGGLVEVTRKKEAELRKREEELDKRRRKEEEEARKISEMEEAQLAQEGKFSSLTEEAEQKTKKLKKLWKKFQEVNAEVDDMYKEFQREKEDLLESIRMLQDQMQLKDMVIEAFIPPEEVGKVNRRAHWDEEREVWVLERLSDLGKRDSNVLKRPVSAAGHRRPTSDFARLATAMGDMNPRFKSENILNLELDMPERTTYDYTGPGVDPRVQVGGLHAS